jgi:hypothetical protein
MHIAVGIQPEQVEGVIGDFIQCMAISIGSLELEASVGRCAMWSKPPCGSSSCRRFVSVQRLQNAGPVAAAAVLQMKLQSD